MFWRVLAGRAPAMITARTLCAELICAMSSTVPRTGIRSITSRPDLVTPRSADAVAYPRPPH